MFVSRAAPNFVCTLAIASFARRLSLRLHIRSDYQVGLAKVDITPEGPIRLSGFYVRQTESIGVREHIYARAMAIRGVGRQNRRSSSPSTASAFPRPFATKLPNGSRRRKSFPTNASRSAPRTATPRRCSAGVLATMFGAPVPPDQQQRIDKYTRELTDKLEQVAISALDNMKPARMQFGIGKVEFLDQPPNEGRTSRS